MFIKLNIWSGEKDWINYVIVMIIVTIHWHCNFEDCQVYWRGGLILLARESSSVKTEN